MTLCKVMLMESDSKVDSCSIYNRPCMCTNTQMKLSEWEGEGEDGGRAIHIAAQAASSNNQAMFTDIGRTDREQIRSRINNN